MQDPAQEIDLDLEVLDDGKKIVITLESFRAITPDEYILELEQHIHLLSQALQNRAKPGVLTH